MEMTADLIKINIGYDACEAVAFSVLAHSIHRRASRPVSILTTSMLSSPRWAIPSHDVCPTRPTDHP